MSYRTIMEKIEIKEPSVIAKYLLPAVTDIIFIRMFWNIVKRPIASLDIWWHMKTGEYILNNKTVPATNMYSYTATDFPWITHEWLSQVSFYGVYNAFGPHGLIFLRAFLFSVMIVIIYKTVTLRKSHFLLAILGIILGSQLLVPAATLRPWLFSNFLAACLVYCFHDKRLDRHLLWLMPVILWFWSNFHGSYVIGYLLAFLKLCELWTSSDSQNTRYKRLFLSSFIVSVFLLLLNPNGLTLLTYPLKYRLGSLFFAYITEWQQPDFHSFFGILLELYCFLLIFSYLFSKRKVRWTELVTALLFFHLVLTARRNSPFLVIATLPSLVYHLDSVLFTFRKFIEKKRETPGGWYYTALYFIFYESDRLAILDRYFRKHTYGTIFLLAALLFFTVTPQEAPDVAYDFDSRVKESFPVAAVDYLEKNRPEGKVLNHFNFGGYLIWRLYPRVKVFIDGRADPYPVEVLTDYYKMHSVQGWQELLEKYDINWVIYPPKEPLAQVLTASDEWNITYEDSQAIVFIKNGKKPAQSPSNSSPINSEILSRRMIH